jgi:hypothetical protein
MRPYVYAFLLALAVAASSLGPAQAQTYYRYECTDGAAFELAFYAETKAAYLQFDGKSLMLPKRFSLTSQRFSKNGITLSMKSGNKATIKHYGKSSQCELR